MPGYDGTGPRGMGAMTGGGRGLCSPTGVGRASGLRRWFAPRFGRGGFAPRGYGQGRGLGRFSFGGFAAPASSGYDESVSAAEGRDALQQQLAAIEDQLVVLRQQLQAMDD